MKAWRIGLLLSVLMFASVSSHSDECIQPRNARLFASASGSHIFRVGQKKASLPEGTLLAITDDFAERRIWRTRLVNVPESVMVADDGETVVSIDNAGCRFGFEHSVVMYGPGGRVVADHRLEDLLSALEIRQHIRQTMAGRLWTEKASLSFDANENAFVVTFQWGRIVKLDLTTGRITRSGDAVGSAEERPASYRISGVLVNGRRRSHR